MSDSRKEAIRKFKEQKVPQGIYAVRCLATGQVWVGSSRNLPSTKNGSWFSLKHGSFHNADLQKEWNSHGEDKFAYEILETLEQDVPALALKDTLKDKAERWSSELRAQTLLSA